MNKKMFYGWREVCGFAYIQTMKSKAMKITMLILCAIAVCVFPVISLIGSGNKEEETSIKDAYVYANNEELAAAYEAGMQSGIYKDIVFHMLSEEESEEKLKELKKADEDTTDVLVEILYDNDPKSLDYGVEFRVIYGEKSAVGNSDASGFAEALDDGMKEKLLVSFGFSETEVDQMLTATKYQIKTIDKNGAISSDDSGLSSMEYGLTYGYLMIIMFAVIIAGSKVAELIVTEKTSKVIEYLLTSVETLALLLGKVISTILIVFTIIAMIGISLLISMGINMGITGSGQFIPSSISGMVSSGVLAGLTPIHIVLGVVMILIGFLFYGFIAGLAGATVGKVEELAEGLKLFTFAVIIGVYLVLALIMMSTGSDGVGTFGTFVYYFPFSSMFVVPIYLLLGKITISTALISFAILIVSTIFIWVFVTKVFESVIYNNGSVIKFKELIAIYKESKKGKKDSEVNK